MSPVSSSALDRVARYLSIIGHPYIVIPASVAAIAILRGGDARAALGVAIAFTAISVVVLLGIRAGRFDDFDVSERRQRPGFYLVMTLGALALAFWLRADAQAFRACLIAAAALAACGVLNRWIKVSLHTVFSLYAAGFWATWSLVAGLIALPIAAAVAWSRVRLGRHSTREVLVGGMVGLCAGLCVLLAVSAV
jgi:membrane-associated phospholipid phosphatase